MLGTEAAEIVSWSPTAIVIAVPAGAAGCFGIGWVLEIGAGPSAFLIYDYDVELTVIGTPTINTFEASKLTATACEPVDLSWQVALGVCKSSRGRVHVSLTRNGAAFQDYLSVSGSITVADETSTTYALSAMSELGAQQCSNVEQSLTIAREPKFTVTAPENACIDQNSIAYFHIELSCPAPDGGLEVLVQSDNPNIISSTQLTVGAGQTSADVALTTSTMCGAVSLTFHAAGYPSVSTILNVVGVPQITGLSRTLFSPCEQIDLDVSGSYLGNSSGMIGATLVNGVPATAIVVRAAEQTIHLSFPPQAVGSYSFLLWNCGRVSAPSPPVTVQPVAQTISAFAVTPSTIDFCDGPSPSISWTVENAHSVIVKLGNQTIITRTANPCGTSTGQTILSDSFSSGQPGTGPVVYTLEATSAWASTVATRTATLNRIFARPTISSLNVFNQCGRPLVLWVLGTALSQGSPVTVGMNFGQIGDGQVKTINACCCVILTIVAIDPALVAQHNSDFDDNLQTSDLMTAQNPRFWRWSAVKRFHSSAPILSESIM
jgi:hypothetical protein